MAMHPVWQKLSRIAIIGTDQLSFDTDLRSELQAWGIAIGQNDHENLKKALAIIGLYQKAAAKLTQSDHQANHWAKQTEEREAPVIRPQVLDQLLKSGPDLIATVLITMQQKGLLFPPSHVPALVTVLSDTKHAETLLYLDSRTVWAIQNLQSFKLVHAQYLKALAIEQLTQHNTDCTQAEAIAKLRFGQYLHRHPQGQKQTLTPSEICSFPSEALILHLEGQHQKAKSSHRSALAQICAPLQSSQLGSQISQAIKKLFDNPNAQATPTDIDQWLKELLPKKAILEPLLSMLLSEKQIDEKTWRKQLLIQMVYCTPTQFWSAQQIPIAQLANLDHGVATALTNAIVDWSDADLANTFIQMLIHPQTKAFALEGFEPPKALFALLDQDQLRLQTMTIISKEDQLVRHYKGLLPNLVMLIGPKLSILEQREILDRSLSLSSMMMYSSRDSFHFLAWLRILVMQFDPQTILAAFEPLRSDYQLNQLMQGNQLRELANLRGRLNSWLQ
jgi:hypothetical protein